MRSRRVGFGGRSPVRPGRRGREGRARPLSGEAVSLLAVLAVALFVLGGVAGFGWSLDRQLRGGLLRQSREAIGRPDWVSLRTLPSYVPAAFIAVVDPSFAQDGALRTHLDGRTLSRELVRQVHLLPRNFGGEAREMVMGPVLERRATKPELLEIFLNRIHLGTEGGYPVYGIYHAAREYFGKGPQQLTLGETATLAGLLLEPRIEDPESRVGAVGVRRNEVLRVMLLGELITPEQYREAVAEPLGFQPGLEEQPMTRPADWMRETATAIRLPEEMRPEPDSAEASHPPG